MTAPTHPVPITDERSAEFWEAAAEERLLVQECTDCKKLQFYPRGHCVHCFGSNVDWREVSGDATLHTYSVLQRTPNEEFADELPYVFAIVDLDEGVRMASRVADFNPDRLRCGMPLKVVFRKLEDGGPIMPLFIESEDRS